MTILDHRILIPKSPEKIWEFLSDLSQNAAWQVDCKSVSILTTSKQTGPGVRWRYTTNSGHAYVAEITAWYDGLGYEYTYVDGAPFRESKGRIRLQEIAEGTVVQWTLTYETSGMLAGMRNAVGLKRQFETSMVDSLKNLWKVLQKVMPEDKPREVKSLMRDAPDYESRTQYRPRHAKLEAEDAVQPPSSVSKIIEPPISLEDTRPRAPVHVEPSPVPEEHVSFAPPAPPPVAEPSSFADEPVAYPVPTPKPEIKRDFTPPLAEKQPEVIPPTQRATQEMKPIIPEPLATTEATSIKDSELEEFAPLPPPQSETKPVTSTYDTVKMATSEMSVFDLFGIPRPSQTQEIAPIPVTEPVQESAPEPSELPETSPAPQPTRIGLRLVLRRKHVSIRRPT